MEPIPSAGIEAGSDGTGMTATAQAGTTEEGPDTKEGRRPHLSPLLAARKPKVP